MWEEVTAWISQLFDKQIVINLTTIFSFGGLVFSIFAKTSLGRKSIAKLTELANKTLEKTNNTNEKVKKVELLATEKINALKDEYERKTLVVVSTFDVVVNGLFAALKEIPNVKVQNQIENFEKKYADQKNEITKVIGKTYGDFKEAVEEETAAARIKLLELQVALDQKLEQADKLIKTLKQQVEVPANGEEREDSDPIKEEV